MIQPLPGTGAGCRRRPVPGPLQLRTAKSAVGEFEHISRASLRAVSQFENVLAGFVDEVSAHPTMRPQAPPASGRRAAAPAVRSDRDSPDAAAPASGCHGRYRHPHLFSKSVLSWVELNRGRTVLRPHQQLRTCWMVSIFPLNSLIEKHPLLRPSVPGATFMV